MSTGYLRDPASILYQFAQASQRVRQTESGDTIVGMVCPGMPWIYWSSQRDLLVCERCKATHATPTAVEPFQMAREYLIPFSTDHKSCLKAEGPQEGPVE